MSHDDNPLVALIHDRDRAREHGDPCVDLCTLATVSAGGQPAARILVLREMTDVHVTLFCSSTSPKWRELRETGAYELLVFWPTIERQARLRGTFEELSPQEVEPHWKKKAHPAKLLDHYYERSRAQSTALPDRAELIEGVAELRREFPDDSRVPVPENAAGLKLVPNRVEIWRGVDDRLHERHVHRLDAGAWRREPVVP